MTVLELCTQLLSRYHPGMEVRTTTNRPLTPRDLGGYWAEGYVVIDSVGHSPCSNPIPPENRYSTRVLGENKFYTAYPTISIREVLL